MGFRAHWAVAALAGAIFAAAGASAATITELYDTGVDSLGNPLPEGATNSHWLLNGSASPFVYDNAAYNVPADARFIAAQADGGYAINPNTYSLSFSLAGLNPATATLSGEFEADNYASVYLNGNLIAQDIQGTVYSNFQSFTAFSAPSADFLAGTNTLTFVVTDTGKPSAVLVDDLVGSASAVPEPASWALMILGFACLGAGMRSRRTAALPAA